MPFILLINFFFFFEREEFEDLREMDTSPNFSPFLQSGSAVSSCLFPGPFKMVSSLKRKNLLL